MASGVFNIAKGRAIELVKRVIDNDPSVSALRVVVLSAAEADAVLQDYDDLATLLAAPGNTEATNTNYARKTITDSDPDIAVNFDDTNNRAEADFSDQTWTAVASGSAWVKALVCYDPTTASSVDSGIIPLTHHDFVRTPNGTDITFALNTAGFVRFS